MASARLSWSPIEDADSYRLMVYDRTAAETVTDETVREATCDVAIPAERGNHDLVMRVRALRGDRWGDWTEFQPLPLELILGERRDLSPPLAPGDDPGLLLLFTIDTECSVLRQPNPDPDRVVDELIFGDFGDGRRPGGIALHMDLLEHFGFRGSFFVDVLMEFEHGQAALERIVEAIAGRGHEVELHIHPEHILWSRDPRVEPLAKELSGGAAVHDQDVFRRLMELSVDLFERRVGRRPVAYRAGAFRIADIHFPVLEEFGICVDSSVQPYFKSQVSNWMRTRTQPFRVGGVLEVPPTFLVLNEKPGEWETRGFAPNPYLGDPVFALPGEPGHPPHVLTFVSHSFQLLRRYDSQAPEEIEAFARRFRSSVPPDLADRLLSGAPRPVRTFGEEVDESLVAHVAGVLRRVADRPDARSVTYSEVAGLIDRFWPSESFPPVDRIALVDRRQGIASSTGTRVFSRDLLSRLAAEETPSSTPCADADSGWVSEVERGGAPGLRDRLDLAAAELEPGQSLRLRLRTLGVMPVERRGALPPLAELLFPLADLRAVAGEVGAEEPDGIPWDALTFRLWFERNGFEVLGERRVPREAVEMAALDRFAEKLRWLDPLELRTEAVELELVYPGSAETDRPNDEGRLGPEAANRLYESTQPGCEVTLSLADRATPTTPTTCLLALMRAGFEVLAREDSEYRLLRPVDLADIRRFAGLAT